MNTQVFILAAGMQKRFPVDFPPKQLLTIVDETLLERQVRQLKNFDLIPVVITKNNLIKAAYKNCHVPDKNNNVVNSLLIVKNTYKTGKIIYLLGDVFYSNELMNDIVQNQDMIKFWVSGSEIFALNFKTESSVIADAEAVIDCSNNCEPKLWHLYRQVNKLSLDYHKLVENENIVCDYTADLDSERQYKDFKSYIELLIREGRKI